MTTSRSDGRGWSAGRALGAAALVALGLFVARLWVNATFDAGAPPMALAEARDLPVTDARGRPGRLGDALRPGVPTVVSLWASWCGPCRKEAPVLADLRRRFGPARLNLVYLNVRDPGAAPPMLAALTREVGLPGDGYWRMDDGSAARLTNSLDGAVPRTYVFDAGGRPRATILGYKPLALARVAGLVGGMTKAPA